MANSSQWMKEAEESAKRYADEIRKQNLHLIDQQNQNKQNTIDQLKNQKQTSINDLNSGRSTINTSALDKAKQANINKMMALQSRQQAMNRGGLGTQGIVGSQVNAINNAYGTTHNSILNEQEAALRDIDRNVANTNLNYDTNLLNLNNEYDGNISNIRSAIEDRALNQYNTVYERYLAQKQQEEEIRRYNEQLEYKKAQDEIANNQAWAQINRSTGNQTPTPNPYVENNINNNLSHISKEIINMADGKYGKQTQQGLVNTINLYYKKGDITANEVNYLLDYLGIK